MVHTGGVQSLGGVDRFLGRINQDVDVIGGPFRDCGDYRLGLRDGEGEGEGQ
jgi:hypothetical protein